MDKLSKALITAGFRERYAMEMGEPETIYENGKEYIRFTYSDEGDVYKDANGATYCVTEGRWVK